MADPTTPPSPATSPASPSWDEVARAVQNTPSFKGLSTDQARSAYMTQMHNRYRATAARKVAVSNTGSPPEDPNNPTDWYTRTIGRPLLNATEAAIGGAIGGPKEYQEVSEHPGAHPILRGAARMVPIAGAESPGQAAIDATMIGLWASGIGEGETAARIMGKLVPQGSKVIAPMMRFGARVAIPGIAGAAGDYAAKGDVLSAAEEGVRGVAQGVGGEIIGGVASQIGDSPLVGRGIENIAEWIDTYIPGAGRLRSIADFDTMFRTSTTNKAGEPVSEIVRHTEDQVDQVERLLKKHLPGDTKLTLQIPREVRAHVDVPGEHVARSAVPEKVIPAKPATRYEIGRTPDIPGVKAVSPTKATKDPVYGLRALPEAYQNVEPGTPTIRGKTQYDTIPPIPKRVIPGQPAIPEGTYQMTFDQAKSLIDDVKRLGWSFKGDMVNNGPAKVMRQFARKAEQEVGAVVEAQARGFGTPWLSSRYRADLAKTLSSMFSEPGVIKGGKVVDSELQKVAIAQGNLGYRDDLVSLLGGKRGMAFLKMIMHGADPGMATDVAGKFSPYFRLHPGLGMLSGHGGGLGFLGGSMGVHPQLPFRAGTPPLDMGRGALWAMYTLGPWGLLRGIYTSMGLDDNDQMPTGDIIKPSHGVVEARR